MMDNSLYLQDHSTIFNHQIYYYTYRVTVLYSITKSKLAHSIVRIGLQCYIELPKWSLLVLYLQGTVLYLIIYLIKY